MTLNVLLFAQARDKAGRASLTLELPEGSVVSDAIAALVRAHPALAPLLPHLAVALDGTLVKPAAALRDGGELAVLPPVSGG